MSEAYYERHLPHWQPDATALFLTWRLHGSLPNLTPVLRPRQTPGERFAAIDKELSRAATGPRWLKDERIANCVLAVLHYGEQPLGLYALRAWVVMANHVHILIYPNAELSRITKTVKGFSAKDLEKIVRYIEGNPVAAGLAERPEDWPWSSAWTGLEACPT